MELASDVNFMQLNAMKKELTRFMMVYKFALDEVGTKLKILEENFN